MATLRIVGDVHGQTDRDNLCVRNARPYLEIIANIPYSIQVGDMGDGETYSQLVAEVDPARHRFYPGNHDHYDRLPPHCLGDFGAAQAGGVEFFFIRGAASTDRGKLIRVGRELGKTLWFGQEELTDDQMQAAELAYVAARPTIVLTHDAPTPIARFAWEYASRLGPPDPSAAFRPSRTSDFLARLWERHQPRLWLFGHYHRDWRYQDGSTQFVCVGQLSYVDINAAGEVSEPN
jgi:hypothetical protein